MKHPNPAIEAYLSTLAHTGMPTIAMGLGRIETLLEQLGRPQRHLPPVVHVAGTNGKGSLLAYLRAMLEQAGYRVHRYTSPHLVRFNERILLAGEEIRDDFLLGLLPRVKALTDVMPVTGFEATTALAFLAFAEVPADILLLETGLGGRLDATNVVELPLLTAITPISLDHMDYLGSSLESIATEKAGILKHAVPCVLGPQPEKALQVVLHKAEKLGVALHCYGKDFTAKREGNALRYEAGATVKHFHLPALAGEHQYINAATAIACVQKLEGFTVSDEHINAGLLKVQWPARLQRLDQGSLAQLVPQGSELWLDGGHNEGAARELAQWMQRQAKPVHLVCGMLKTKDAHAFLNHLLPHAGSLCAIPIEGDALSQQPEVLQAVAVEQSIRNFLTKNIKNAIEHIVENNKNDIIVLICGSLSLAGNSLWQNSQAG